MKKRKIIISFLVCTLMSRNMSNFFFLKLILILALNLDQGWARRRSKQTERDGKLFPIFQVVTFPNDPCTTGTRNGTCYTVSECSSRGGSNTGSACASGYGVCCTFQRTCGQMTNENCTYFISPAAVTTTSDCTFTVCPCSNNICQIRLDFNMFTITGPSISSDTLGRTLFGNFVKATAGFTGKLVSSAGQCLTDVFSVTSPGNTNPPQLCGALTGEHLYVDLNGGNCDELRFSLLDNANGGANAGTREWDIKVTQYSCDFNNLAPSGCTQYFFGSSTGTINNYNFPAQHLADQNQQICIRREQDFCRICFVPTAAMNFDLSGPTGFAGRPDKSTFCCGYGTNGLASSGFDCIEIPGVTGATMGGDPFNSRFCGRNQGFSAAIAGQTVCTSMTPFSVIFRSDRFEFLDQTTASEGASPDRGFQLAFTQDAIMC